MSSLEEKTLEQKQYKGNAKTHQNTTENIKISKIKTLPITEETIGEYVPSINGGLSYNIDSQIFTAEILLPTVMTNTDLSIYQSDTDATKIYLTYHGVNNNDKSKLPTTYNLWTLNYKVNLDKVNVGDTLTVRMLNWRDSAAISERTEDPEISRGTETTVQGTGGE